MSGKAATAQSRTFQRPLFPLELTELFQSDQGSADLKLIGRATNGKDYAIKTVQDSVSGKVPASELFCYELANQLQIATPDYQLISMRDSTLAFGSAWEGGVILLTDQAKIMDMLTGLNKPSNIVQALSKIYALDVFVNNIDRHIGNYLFRDGYKSTIILAMDFSRAWYEVNPYSYEAAEDTSLNTDKIIKILRLLGCYDSNVALNTLEKIENIPQDTIRQILSLMPTGWLDLTEESDFIQWWSSDDFKLRIKKLRQVL